MECLDRIVMQMTETALQPVRSLGRDAAAGAVTTRAYCSGRRVDITIDRVWLDGDARRPAYRWRAVELDGGGMASGPGSHPDPEEAFWAAIDAISAVAATRASGAGEERTRP